MIFRTLRFRLLLAFFLVILISILVTGSLTLTNLRRTFMDERRESALMSANMVVNAVRPVLETVSGEELAAMARRQGEQLGARVVVFDAEARVLADQYGELLGTTIQQREVTLALDGESVTSVRQLPDGGALFAVVPVYSGMELVGGVLLAFDLLPLELSLQQWAQRLMVSSLLGSALAALLGYLLAVRFTRPLTGLAAAARRLAEGELATRAPERGAGELVEVARAFNHMAERMEEAERMRGLFISNAAHELRSPIASIKVLAQTLLDEEGNDEELLQEYLQDMDGEADRLALLGDALLDIVRYQRKGSLQLTRVRVQEAAEAAWAEVGRVFDVGAINFVVQMDEELEWPLDGTWFTTLLYNLCYNAAKYVPTPGGQVKVTACVFGDELVTQVEDNGEGIPQEHLSRVFERFYRVDKARSRKTGGLGLGLSIVREIVEAHHGSITVQSRPGKTRFTFSIPQRQA